MLQLQATASRGCLNLEPQKGVEDDAAAAVC